MHTSPNRLTLCILIISFLLDYGEVESKGYVSQSHTRPMYACMYDERISVGCTYHVSMM